MAGNNRLGTPMEKLERIVIAVNSFPLMSLYDLTQRQRNAILRFRFSFRDNRTVSLSLSLPTDQLMTTSCCLF
jgi:hypothetical protein